MTVNHTPSRRSVLAALGGAGTLLAAPARAQDAFPNRPSRFIVPFPPGGSQDVLGRLISERLAAAYGQPVVVENRAGSAGNVGVNAIARSDPDGYTMGIATIGPLTAHTALYRTLPFNPQADFTFLSYAFELPNVLVVNLNNPVRTVQEFIAWIRSRPEGTVQFGTPGLGTTAHLGTEFFARQIGVKLTHVPYRTGAVAVQDLIAGRLDFMFDNLPTIIGQIQGNQIRSLAVSTAQRWPGLPDVPTMIEGGVQNFDVTSWTAIVGPRGIPQPVAQRISSELGKLGQDNAFRIRFRELGANAIFGGPDAVRAKMASETPRWTEVINALGLKVD